MQILDFHTHSRYSRACSKQLDLEHIKHWCRIKGLDVVACSDFTHPAWFKEIAGKLRPLGNGLFQLDSPDTAAAVAKQSGFLPDPRRLVRFILATEISCIYSQGGAVRRVH